MPLTKLPARAPGAQVCYSHTPPSRGSGCPSIYCPDSTLPNLQIVTKVTAGGGAAM